MLIFLKIDPSVDISVENWATITVNSEVITWESSNDLCTFYRNQPIVKSYEDLTTSPVPYTEVPPISSPPHPPATIDIIPPTPTTVISEPPPLCTRCSCDIQKQTNQLNDDDSNLATTLSDKLTGLQSSIQQNNIETTQNDSSKTSTQETFIKSVPAVSSTSSTKSSLIASTSTTQLHRSQVCSTEISSSSCSVVNKDQVNSNSPVINPQTTATANRPSTPHKPSYSKKQWKDQPTRSQSSINSNVVNSTKVVPLSITQDKSAYSNTSSNFGPYPLKKHPLINIKAGNILKVASVSNVAPKLKVIILRFAIRS